MFWRVRGFGRKGLAFQAISALDIALWDLKGKALGVPLYKLLGQAHDSVPCYGSGGWTNYTVDELVAEQTGYVDMGFPRVKMKVGMNFGNDERADIERLEAVRKAVGDDVEIFVDANNGYYAKQAIRMSRKFEDYDVGWFEEPVLADDIQGLAEISKATNIPVATGEHEYTKLRLQRANFARWRRHRATRHRQGRGRNRMDEDNPPRRLLQPPNRASCVLTTSPPLHDGNTQPKGRRSTRRRNEIPGPSCSPKSRNPSTDNGNRLKIAPDSVLRPNPDTIKNLSFDSDVDVPGQRGF